MNALKLGSYIFECQSNDNGRVQILLFSYLNLYTPIQITSIEGDLIFADATSARLSNLISRFPCNLTVFKNEADEVVFRWEDL